MADLLGVLPQEIVCVSNGSEGNSLALFGICEKWMETHKEPGHLITASVEHSCSLKAADKLEGKGWRVTRLPVNEFGRLQASDLKDALSEDTALVSIQWANNEVGTVQPIEEMASICQEVGTPFHCDAVQGIGLLPLPSPIPDLMTIAAHKFYGPKGIAALIVKDGVELTAQVMGGGQEFDLRAGTENTPGIVGMAKALELSLDDTDGTAQKIQKLRDYLVEEILNNIDDTSLNGDPEHRLPNFANIRFAGRSAETLVIKMDMEGICVSSGAACVTGTSKPSHVLEAMGRSAEEALENLRFSLGKGTTKEEVETTVDVLKEIIKK